MSEITKLKTASERSSENMVQMLESLLADIQKGEGPSRILLVETHETGGGGFDLEVSHSCNWIEVLTLLDIAKQQFRDRIRAE